MTINAKIPPIFSVAIGAVVIGILFVLIKWGAPVLTPILVAAFLAALAAPVYFWLQKRGVSSSMSLIILIILIVVAVLLLIGLLWLSASRLAVGIANYQTGLESGGVDIEKVLGSVGITEASLRDAFTGEKLAGLLAAFAGAIAGFVGDLLFGLVLVAFLLGDARRLYGLATTVISDRPFFGKLPEIANTVITYFSIRTRLNFLTGIGFGLILFILGVDYALLWGVLAFVLSYVPYIGLFTAMIPPTLLALAEFGIGAAALVILAGLAINLLIENIVEPRFTGKILKLSPVMVDHLLLLLGLVDWFYRCPAVHADHGNVDACLAR